MAESGDDQRERALRQATRMMRAGLRLGAFGLMGLVVGWIVRESAGLTEVEQTASWLGSLLVWLFSACFVGGWFVVLPASSVFYRRAGVVQRQGETSKLTVQDEAAADAPVQLATREIVPRWIGWPIWAFVAAASLWIIYMVLVHGIPSWFARR